MGYSPLLWGREAWHFIHYVCLNYPLTPTEKEKELYRQFFLSLADVLPCPICGIHFLENIANNPIRLENNKELFEWSVDMHNEVNKVNGSKVLSYEEALAELQKNSTRGRIETHILNHSKVKYLNSRLKQLKNK